MWCVIGSPQLQCMQSLVRCSIMYHMALCAGNASFVRNPDSSSLLESSGPLRFGISFRLWRPEIFSLESWEGQTLGSTLTSFLTFVSLSETRIPAFILMCLKQCLSAEWNVALGLSELSPSHREPTCYMSNSWMLMMSSSWCYFCSPEPLRGPPHRRCCLPVLQWCRWPWLCDHGDLQTRTYEAWQVHTGELLFFSFVQG